MSDVVFLRNIRLTATVGKDCWHRSQPQPVKISIRHYTDIELAAETDDVLNTIDYGNVFKAVAKKSTDSTHETLEAFARAAGGVALEIGRCKRVLVYAHLPKALIRAEGGDGGVGLEIEIEKGPDSAPAVTSTVLHIKGLRLCCIIGVNPHERKEKQVVVLNLKLYSAELSHESDYQSRFAPVVEVSVLAKIPRGSLAC
jgi:FolB domain-containing protein